MSHDDSRDLAPATRPHNGSNLTVRSPDERVGDRFHTFVESAVERASQVLDFDDPMVLRLSLMLRKVNQLMADDANRKIHVPDGWTQTSFRVCFALWVSGSLPPHRISAATNLSRATVSAAIKKVEKDGLVVRKQSAVDQRSTVLSLTQEGETAIVRSYDSHIELEHQWFQPLTDTERLLLFSLLDKLLYKGNPDPQSPGAH